MITTVTQDNCFDFRGLSTDVKPIGSNAINYNVKYPIANGSSFIEMDTGKIFLYILTPVADASQTAVTGAWIDFE